MEHEREGPQKAEAKDLRKIGNEEGRHMERDERNEWWKVRGKMVGKREATVCNQDSRMRGDQHRGCETEWKSERERERKRKRARTIERKGEIEKERERETERERRRERGRERRQ